MRVYLWAGIVAVTVFAAVIGFYAACEIQRLSVQAHSIVGMGPGR